MRILVITTGGTIGSSFEGGAIRVNADAETPVIARYQQEFEDAEFEVIAPLNILSESLAPRDLEILAKSLYDAELSCCDGVVVTCGSDALAYLSCFVGLLFGNTEKTVALVAANKILTAPDSNGWENFKAAVGLVKAGVRGVFVPYRNDDDVIYVHEATKLRQASYSDNFFSMDGAFAVWNGALLVRGDHRPERIPDSIFSRECPPVLRKKVLMVEPYPFLDYGAVCAENAAAVLHTAYHSGTLNVDSAAAFVRSLDGKPLYLCSLKRGRQIYETTARFLEMGAKPLYDVSPECAYIKLLLAVNQSRVSVDDFMRTEG